MAQIVIQVDEMTGKYFDRLSIDKQIQISDALSLLLKKASNDVSEMEYKALLDEFGQKAETNGLTEELLVNLLTKE